MYRQSRDYFCCSPSSSYSIATQMTLDSSSDKSFFQTIDFGEPPAISSNTDLEKWFSIQNNNSLHLNGLLDECFSSSENSEDEEPKTLSSSSFSNEQNPGDDLLFGEASSDILQDHILPKAGVNLESNPVSSCSEKPKRRSKKEQKPKERVLKEAICKAKRGKRRKIKIEFIKDKGKRHVTFSKRKAGLIKKAHELSALTGTEVLLLMASETGNVYSYSTPLLQVLVTKPEGKALISSCLTGPRVKRENTLNTLAELPTFSYLSSPSNSNSDNTEEEEEDVSSPSSSPGHESANGKSSLSFPPVLPQHHLTYVSHSRRPTVRVLCPQTPIACNNK